MAGSLPPAPPLWFCPSCGAPLVSVNLSHSCVRLRLADTFAGCAANVLPTFERFADVARQEAATRGARVRVIPQRSRVVIVARVRFAGGEPRKHHVLANFALRRALDDPRIRRVVDHGPRWQRHELLLADPGDVDDEVRGWLRESVGVGLQDDRYEWVPGALDG